MRVAFNVSLSLSLFVSFLALAQEVSNPLNRWVVGHQDLFLFFFALLKRWVLSYDHQVGLRMRCWLVSNEGVLFNQTRQILLTLAHSIFWTVFAAHIFSLGLRYILELLQTTQSKFVWALGNNLHCWVMGHPAANSMCLLDLKVLGLNDPGIISHYITSSQASIVPGIILMHLQVSAPTLRFPLFQCLDVPSHLTVVSRYVEQRWMHNGVWVLHSLLALDCPVVDFPTFLSLLNPCKFFPDVNIIFGMRYLVVTTFGFSQSHFAVYLIEVVFDDCDIRNLLHGLFIISTVREVTYWH